MTTASAALPRGAQRPPAAALAAADDRSRLAVKLAAYAGLRPVEIAGLHTGQISETDVLVMRPGGRRRRVPLHPDLARELRAELARRRRGSHGTGWSGRWVTEHGYLFPSESDPSP
jgi:integrase